MTLRITFTDEQTRTLTRLYIQIAEGGEAGARAESEVVTLLGEKLGEEIEEPRPKEVM
ncbi:hypothetical protein G3I13_01890 [Streptomyces sp. SID6673]|nr:hypothetical protein [Streptomyces sp. SID11726]NDZ94912.1 hypothetical protein [Streptomyces sp. SID11726]NEB23072.1 hypothetical protein [Streptomyces sp. SID6673]